MGRKIQGVLPVCRDMREPSPRTGRFRKFREILGEIPKMFLR
jgi:hypothetical protein